ncbi:MAG TPA: S8 family serine peptidase [Mycobacteriales bacterium]|nr:S8 family serine peptidase [Mycobacteriales bacterium]
MALAAAISAAPVALSASAATAHPTRDAVVCKHAGTARARCFAIRVDRLARGRVRHSATPLGYAPSDLAAAYDLPAAGTDAGSGETVAVVDAYDDPTAESDLALYRKQFHLPACTGASGCFRKVDERGGTDYPPADPGWSEEISLDVDMVSAVCPNCHILLVEADTASMANLGAAVDEAVALGADAVSNSYGGPDAKDSTYGRYYHHAGVAVTASAGDNGYGVSYPASSKWVTAVGGTTLSRSTSSRGFTETAWTDGGSGCSDLNATTWQSADVTGCDGRAVADVAAVADPATGVAVYDSTPYESAVGWLTFGGTSASSPIIAAVFALAGNTTDVSDGSFVWEHQSVSSLWDVTGGSNGQCPTAQWCQARTGWDGPTGWGTPHGVAAF